MATESVPIQKAPTSESNHVNGSPLITLETLKKMPIEEIWSRVAEMQQICRHKEIDLHTAAEIGQRLLRTNDELENNLKKEQNRISSLKEHYENQFAILRSQSAASITIEEDQGNALEVFLRSELPDLQGSTEQNLRLLKRKLRRERDSAQVLREQLDSVQSDSDQLKETLNITNGALRTTKQLAERLEDQLLLSQQEVQRKHETLTSEFDSVMEKTNKITASLQSQNALLRSVINELEAEKHVAQEHVVKGKSDQDTVSIKIVELEEQCNQLQKEKQQLQSLTSQLEKDLQEVQRHQQHLQRSPAQHGTRLTVLNGIVTQSQSPRSKFHTLAEPPSPLPPGQRTLHEELTIETIVEPLEVISSASLPSKETIPAKAATSYSRKTVALFVVTILFAILLVVGALIIA